jgi:glucose-6-phosphate 1-dehydrogenase
MNNCVFVILGATGDLARRKLFPALYKLIQDKKIDNFIVVGAAFEQVSPDYIIDRSKEFIPIIDEDIWQRLKKSTYYQQLDFTNSDDFKRLAMLVTSLEREHNLAGNRLIYLAVPAHLFCTITTESGKSGLVKKATDEHNKIWHRIVYEKPFGTSLENAREINKCIQQYFTEKQVYRIDHYLTKELVGSILLVRFTNMIFEPLWNKKYIDQVQIILSETLGMEGRGRYYDQYGVLKDIVQNHIMQLIALTAMELPQELNAHYISNQKSDVLQKVQCEDGIFGQYKGYKNEKDVQADSLTPTFAQLRMTIDTERWCGVPFYIKTGKALHRKNSSIHIKFKEVECQLRERCAYTSNYLTIQISPDASFLLQLNTKQPGTTHEVTPINLSFSHNYVFGTMTPEAYEVLLEQIMLGEQSISVRFDEIEYSWEIIEQIETMNLPLFYYEQRSEGPQEAVAFSKKYNIRWRV